MWREGKENCFPVLPLPGNQTSAPDPLCLEGVTGSFTSHWCKNQGGSPGVNNRTELGGGGGQTSWILDLTLAALLSLDFLIYKREMVFPDCAPTSQCCFQDQMRRLSAHVSVCCYDQGLTHSQVILNIMGAGHEWAVDLCELFLVRSFISLDYVSNAH